jgi:hypothetical protein
MFGINNQSISALVHLHYLLLLRWQPTHGMVGSVNSA